MNGGPLADAGGPATTAGADAANHSPRPWRLSRCCPTPLGYEPSLEWDNNIDRLMSGTCANQPAQRSRDYAIGPAPIKADADRIGKRSWFFVGTSETMWWSAHLIDLRSDMRGNSGSVTTHRRRCDSGPVEGPARPSAAVNVDWPIVNVGLIPASRIPDITRFRSTPRKQHWYDMKAGSPDGKDHRNAGPAANRKRYLPTTCARYAFRFHHVGPVAPDPRRIEFHHAIIAQCHNVVAERMAPDDRASAWSCRENAASADDRPVPGGGSLPSRPRPWSYFVREEPEAPETPQAPTTVLPSSEAPGACATSFHHRNPVRSKGRMISRMSQVAPRNGPR